MTQQTSSRIITSISVLLFLLACAPKTYNSMIWKSESISIDGNREEWGNPLRYYDSKSKLFYELRNDKQNLYIAFSANDGNTAMRIMQKGIKIFIDTAKGKNDYPLSIVFPMNKKGDMPPPRDFRPQNDSTHHPMGKRVCNMQIGGFNAEESSIIESRNNQFGIEGEVSISPQSFFGELKIPFKSFYKKELTKTDSIKPLFFEIRLDAAERSDLQMPKGNPDEMESGERNGMHGGPPQGGGFSGGGMQGGPPPGGMGQGGPGGGRPPQGGGEMQQNATPNIFRFELRPKVID